MIKKGDIVTVKAFVYTAYGTAYGERIYTPQSLSSFANVKSLYRSECTPWEGIVVGYTSRATGYYSYARGDYDSYEGTLHVDKYHKVWLVESLRNDHWKKPTECLEEDLESG